MRVLLSIKPEFALKIFNGSKKYEFRRSIFKNQDIDKVIVYASHPLKRIEGEFEIEDIIHDELPILWEKTKKHSGISKKKFFDYFTNKSKGYALQIKSTKKYDTPLSLTNLLVTSPPQSFMYLR
jgi:predicted transcriptional regulator